MPIGPTPVARVRLVDQAVLASLVNESRKIDESTQPRSVAMLSHVSTTAPRGAARLGYQALRWPCGVP